MPRPPRTSLRRAVMAVALAAGALTATCAHGAPSRDELARRARSLDAADRALQRDLDDARASLAATRARTDALEQRYAAQVAIVSARLRAEYDRPPESPLVALMAGDVALAQAEADIREAANRSDSALLQTYAVSLGELRAAQRDLERRKRALAGRERLLAARRARAHAQLEEARVVPKIRVVRSAARDEAPVSPVAGGGLPRALLDAHRLPGSAPIDSATGRPVEITAPSAQAAPGTVPAPTERYAGPRRLQMVAGVLASPNGYRTAVGVPYDPAYAVAVHRTLPLGSTLLVRHGALSLRVRIVDRGPYRTDRDLELSPAAAAALDVEGSTQVSAEVLG